MVVKEKEKERKKEKRSKPVSDVGGRKKEMFTSLCESRELHAKILCDRQFPILFREREPRPYLNTALSPSSAGNPIFSRDWVDTIWGRLEFPFLSLAAEVFMQQSSFYHARMKDEKREVIRRPISKVFFLLFDIFSIHFTTRISLQISHVRVTHTLKTFLLLMSPFFPQKALR